MSNGQLVAPDQLQICGTVYSLNPFRVKPFEGQIRKRFRGIKELAASIKEVKQTTPIKVRLVTGDPDYDAELCDGERRLKACMLLKWPVRAMEDDGIRDEDTRFEHCVAANFGRQDHDPMEIAQAALHLQEKGKTIAQIAAVFGKSQGWVGQYLSLNKLDPEVQAMLIPADEEVSDDAEDSPQTNGHSKPITLAFTIALMLVRLPMKQQIETAKEIMGKGMGIAAARRVVLRAGNAVGEDGTSAMRFRPREEWSTFRRLTTTGRERALTMLEMPGRKFDQMVQSGSQADKIEAVEELRRLVEELTQIADAIERVHVE